MTSPGTRVWALLRARLGAHAGHEGAPVAALLVPGAISALLCGLVHGELPPFGYAIFALSITAGMVAIPLLGELGYLLRSDEAADWVCALPAHPRELTAARVLHLLLLLVTLGSATLVPAAVLLSGGLAAKLTLFGSGLCLVLSLAAALLLVQRFLGGRAESLLVAFQTLVVMGVVVGFVRVIRAVNLLQSVEGWSDELGLLAVYPVTWFSLALGAHPVALQLTPVAFGLVALAVLALVPPPRVPAANSRGVLASLLQPARALASRFWLRPDERPTFDLVFDGAPKEREFVLRTYPMIGIPLAFLLAAVMGEDGADTREREGLLSLLLFGTGIYLPILLTQLPASASHRARWILDSAPIAASAVSNGALKAIAVRFLLPLYAILGALAWQQAGGVFALRLVAPAALVSLFILRQLYGTCVAAPPLSMPPDEMTGGFDWAGVLVVWVAILTVLSVLANVFLTSVALGLVATAVLLLIEVVSDRAWRHDAAPTSRAT